MKRTRNSVLNKPVNLIVHRKNSIADLIATPSQYGVEVDIRSVGSSLILHHDPFVVGEDFETWLSEYHHGTLILNVKEEGLEELVLETMQRHNISDFFLLDQSFPFLIKWANRGERRCAVRVSEFESIETALTLAGKIDWVWVDCFTHFPLNASSTAILKEAGFKLCLVSPELQARTAELEIPMFFDCLCREGLVMDAICTKRPELWENLYDMA